MVKKKQSNNKPQRKRATGAQLDAKKQELDRQYVMYKNWVRKSEVNTLANKACGLVDPFCEHAIGAKYPDDASVKTLSYTSRYNYYLSTDANGNAAALLAPQISYNIAVPCTVNFPTLVCLPTGTNFDPSPVTALSGYSKFRIVSCGFRLRNITAPLYASGMVYIRSYGTEGNSSFTTFEPGTYAASNYIDIPLQQVRDASCIFEHTSQMPQTFYAPPASSAILGWTAVGFNPMTIALLGGPASTNCLVLEFVVHMEYTFQEGEALQLAATPAPPMNPQLTGIAGAITSAGKTVFQRSTTALSTWVYKKAVEYGTRAVMSALGPAGAAASTALVPIGWNVD
jgi:hypothetical protein